MTDNAKQNAGQNPNQPQAPKAQASDQKSGNAAQSASRQVDGKTSDALNAKPGQINAKQDNAAKTAGKNPDAANKQENDMPPLRAGDKR